MVDTRDDRGWLRGAAAPVVLALLVLSALTFVTMRPAITDCTSTIRGGPGDATAGGVWSAWVYETEGGPPWRGRTELTGAPHGEAFFRPHLLSAVVLLTAEWAFAKVTNPTCAWNLTLFSGYLASGLAMFALAYWLTRNTAAGLLAMYAFTFSPYRAVKSTGHVAYVHAEGIVLVLLACLLLWQRPTWPRSVLAGVALGGCAYIDAYYALFGGVAFAAFHAAAFTYSAVVERWRGRDVRRMLATVAAAGGVAAVLMAPLALAVFSGRGEVGDVSVRPRSDLTVYSARLHEYLLPSPLHPLFGDWASPIRAARIHESNLSEQNVYLGVPVMGLAAAAALTVLHQRRARSTPVPGGGLSQGFVVFVLGSVALVAGVFSAPPRFELFGIDVPGPSSFVYSVVQAWRAYARFFILVHAALVAMAAIAVAMLVRGRSRPVQAVVLLALTGLVVFDQLPLGAPGRWSYRSSPDAYAFARALPEQTLAEYPLVSSARDPNNTYLTYQPVHEKRMVNVRISPSPPDAIARTLAGLGDPGTIPVLRAYGTGLVIVHTRMLFGDRPPEPAPPGLELLRSFRYRPAPDVDPTFADTDVYRVTPGPTATLAVAAGDGFQPADASGWSAAAWMHATGRLRVVPVGPLSPAHPARAVVTFEAAPHGAPRRLVAVQDGVELFRGVVASPVPVRFEAVVGRDVVLHASEVPGQLGPPITVQVSELMATPA